jgi:hypothetical protein
MAPAVVNANFPPKTGTILGTNVELLHSNPDDTILKKLGLQGVSDEDKQIIMRAFYITPPESASVLSLQEYPEIQDIVKPLLLQLIQKQEPDIIIQQTAAERDSSIPIQYEKTTNHGVRLSIQLPSYLVHNKKAITIEATGVKKGIQNGTVHVNESTNTVDKSTGKPTGKPTGKSTDMPSIGKPLRRKPVGTQGTDRFVRPHVNAMRLLPETDASSEVSITPFVKKSAPNMSARPSANNTIVRAKNRNANVRAAQDSVKSENDNLEHDEKYASENELQPPIDYYERGPPENNSSNIDPYSRDAILSYFKLTKPSSYHTQLKTKDTRHMLDYFRSFIYKKVKGKYKREPTRDGDTFTEDNELLRNLKADLTRFKDFTFISNNVTFTFHGKERLSEQQMNKDIIPIIRALPPYLAEIVSNFNQHLYGTILSSYIHDNNDNNRPVFNKKYEYNTLITVLPDKIVYQTSGLYEQAQIDMNTIVEKLPFIGMVTVEIDPRTLNGFIQFDKYDIDGMVQSLIEQIKVENKQNFEIASTNAQNTTFGTMLARIYNRSNARFGHVKGGKNDYYDSLDSNAKSAQQSDIELLRRMIDTFELDDTIKRKKLDKLNSIKDNYGKVGSFITQYKNELVERKEEFTIPPIELWYEGSKDSMPNASYPFDIHSYEPSVQDAIRKSNKQPEMYQYIYEQFMTELEKMVINSKSVFDANDETNNIQNAKLFELLSDDKLSEILMEITEFRSINASSWLPSLLGIFRRRSIRGKLEERNQFHQRVNEQTIHVANTSVECAKASTYYHLIQLLENAIGLYLNDKKEIKYEEKPVHTVSCTIPDDDKILPPIKEAEALVDKLVESKKPISDADVKKIEQVLEEAIEEIDSVEAAVDAAVDAIHVEEAQAIAVAIAAQQDLDDLENKQIAVPIAARQDLDDSKYDSNSDSNKATSSTSEQPTSIQSQLNAINKDIESKEQDLKLSINLFKTAAAQAERTNIQEELRKEVRKRRNEIRTNISKHQRNITSLKGKQRELQRKLKSLQKASVVNSAIEPQVSPVVSPAISPVATNYFAKMANRVSLKKKVPPNNNENNNIPPPPPNNNENNNIPPPPNNAQQAEEAARLAAEESKRLATIAEESRLAEEAAQQEAQQMRNEAARIALEKATADREAAEEAARIAAEKAERLAAEEAEEAEAAAEENLKKRRNQMKAIQNKAASNKQQRIAREQQEEVERLAREQREEAERVATNQEKQRIQRNKNERNLLRKQQQEDNEKRRANNEQRTRNEQNSWKEIGSIMNTQRTEKERLAAEGAEAERLAAEKAARFKNSLKRKTSNFRAAFNKVLNKKKPQKNNTRKVANTPVLQNTTQPIAEQIPSKPSTTRKSGRNEEWFKKAKAQSNKVRLEASNREKERQQRSEIKPRNSRLQEQEKIRKTYENNLKRKRNAEEKARKNKENEQRRLIQAKRNAYAATKNQERRAAENENRKRTNLFKRLESERIAQQERNKSRKQKEYEERKRQYEEEQRISKINKLQNQMTELQEQRNNSTRSEAEIKAINIELTLLREKLSKLQQGGKRNHTRRQRVQRNRTRH